jgi:hypothetical protein
MGFPVNQRLAVNRPKRIYELDGKVDMGGCGNNPIRLVYPAFARFFAGARSFRTRR